jgi:hypothetical protein
MANAAAKHGGTINLTSEQKLVARRMARDGATYAQIYEGIQFTGSRSTFERKMKALNIVTSRAFFHAGSCRYHDRHHPSPVVSLPARR